MTQTPPPSHTGYAMPPTEPHDPLQQYKQAQAATVKATGQRCTRCIYDESLPAIEFDDDGVCNYCKVHDQLVEQYPLGREGEARLQALVKEIKTAGRGLKYDCVVGVSGGCDSSYLLYKMKEMGLRPLAAHFDNTWNAAVATDNIRNVLKALDVDLFTIVVDNKEYDDIIRAFFRAGTPDLEAPTDIGLAVTHYRAAQKYGIKYIIEGHSFRTEGISPLGWLYMDGRYIRDVHRRFGTRKMKTYPNMPLSSFLNWMIVKDIKKVRPLYYLDYDKEAVKGFLTENFGWQWYGGHHLENRLTRFFHTYFWPRRFGQDGRLLCNSAMVRSGQMSRAAALAEIAAPPECDPAIIELFKTRLGLSNDEFEHLMTQPRKTFMDYKSYKKTFEALKPLFWALLKMNKVTYSFYMKYTGPATLPKWAQGK